MDDKLVDYINYVVELSRLLDMHFLWDGYGYSSIGAETLVGKSVVGVMDYHNQGNYDYRDVEIAKLGLLVQQLQRVEIYSKKLLKRFKDEIYKTSHNWETYFGVR